MLKIRASSGVLDISNDFAGTDRGADLGRQARHYAGLMGGNGLFHLHCLDHYDVIALGDFVSVAHRQLDDRPLHREVNESPLTAAPDFLPAPRLVFLELCVPASSPAGSTTSSRRPSTSTVTRSRSPASAVSWAPEYGSS